MLCLLRTVHRHSYYLMALDIVQMHSVQRIWLLIHKSFIIVHYYSSRTLSCLYRYSRNWNLHLPLSSQEVNTYLYLRQFISCKQVKPCRDTEQTLSCIIWGPGYLHSAKVHRLSGQSKSDCKGAEWNMDVHLHKHNCTKRTKLILFCRRILYKCDKWLGLCAFTESFYHINHDSSATIHVKFYST